MAVVMVSKETVVQKFLLDCRFCWQIGRKIRFMCLTRHKTEHCIASFATLTRGLNLISRRRTFFASLLGCTVVLSGSAWSQPAPAVGGIGVTGNFDAAGAASNSASLPPPAPLPAGTLQALNPGTATVPIQGAPAPLVTLPALPMQTQVTAPVAPATGVGMPTYGQVPAAFVPAPDVPPVVLPSAPMALPNIIEPAKNIAPSNDAPLVSTASGGPILPTVPNQEILALQRHPLPALSPDSPLIPGPSLAETTNQKRQVTTLPGSGGDTNYAYATVGGLEGPARPLITPPSIVEPVQGTDIGKAYPPLQAVMPQPQATPLYWDEPESAFGTPNPPNTLTYYNSKIMRRNPDLVAANPSPNNAEVIVLRGGQEFQGLILERGDTWRVELLNGTVIMIPGNKVSHIRKLLAVPTSTPTGRRKVFPPEPLYQEQPNGRI